MNKLQAARKQATSTSQAGEPKRAKSDPEQLWTASGGPRARPRRCGPAGTYFAQWYSTAHFPSPAWPRFTRFWPHRVHTASELKTATSPAGRPESQLSPVQAPAFGGFHPFSWSSSGSRLTHAVHVLACMLPNTPVGH